MAKQLFDEANLDYDRVARPACTPESLAEFVQRFTAANGHGPTLGDCKQEFGGILGVLTSGWELQRRAGA